MNTSMSSPPLDLSPALADEVHFLLSRRTRDIRLRGELLALHQRQSWDRRSKQVRAWMYWVIAINFGMLFLYDFLIPQAFWLGLLVSGIVIPLACFLVAFLWRKPRSPFVEGLSTTLSGAFSVAVIAILGSVAGGYHQERFVTGALFIVATSIILFAVEFAWTVALGMAAIAIFAITHLFNPLMSLPTVLSVSVFYFAGLGALVVSRKTANILAMHAFLVSLRDRMNAKALAEANEQLQILATRDPLTGIANRRMVTDHLAQIWANPDGCLPVTIVMIDIDHFKGVNDTLGHREGDSALRQVADTISASIRPYLDTAARYGGEEFIVVLKEAPRSFAISLAESMRRKIEALAIANPGAPVGGCVTVSIGVAFARDEETAEQVVQRADAALYQAKGNGRNRVVVSAPDNVRSVLEQPGSGIGGAFEEPAIAAAG